MTSPAELAFPVLAITHQGLVYTVADEAALRTANVLAVKRAATIPESIACFAGFA